MPRLKEKTEIGFIVCILLTSIHEYYVVIVLPEEWAVIRQIKKQYPSGKQEITYGPKTNMPYNILMFPKEIKTIF